MRLLEFIWMVAIAVAPRPMPSADSRPAITGTVTVENADGDVLTVPGVRVTLRCGSADTSTIIEVSDERGLFRFDEVPVDTCSVGTELQGFSGRTVQVNTTPGQVTTLRLHLALTPVSAGVLVTGARPADPHPTSCASTLRPNTQLHRSKVKTCKQGGWLQPIWCNESGKSSRRTQGFSWRSKKARGSGQWMPRRASTCSRDFTKEGFSWGRLTGGIGSVVRSERPQKPIQIIAESRGKQLTGPVDREW